MSETFKQNENSYSSLGIRLKQIFMNNFVISIESHLSLVLYKMIIQSYGTVFSRLSFHMPLNLIQTVVIP